MMTIRTVFLHAAAETLDPGRSAAAYALGLADAFDAHLEALALPLDMTTPRATAGDADGAGDRAEALRAAARARGITAEVITDRSHIHSTPEIAADHGRLADMIVAGVRNEGLLSERMVAEALIFQSGRPVILIPDDHSARFSAERIVVAWDFSRVAARALSDALPLLRRAREVTLISFGDDKDLAPSISQDEVLTALRRRGIAASFRTMERGSRDIGEAIQAAAAECRAELLVMGGFGHSRLRDFVLGGATRSILAATRLPSLISH